MISALVAAMGLTLTSDAFAPGARIPAASMATQCKGSNREPVLRWANVPAGVRSFALIERDPDAPIPGGFYHWVVYDVPAAARSLGGSPAGRVGMASTGRAAYFGPCPPPGPPHHYVFTLYALDVEHAGGSDPLTGPQLEARLRGHVLARATLEAIAASIALLDGSGLRVHLVAPNRRVCERPLHDDRSALPVRRTPVTPWTTQRSRFATADRIWFEGR